MGTMSMGFYYEEGKRVGYNISCPNVLGGKTTLSNVAYSNKARIIKEMKELGHSSVDIEVERVELGVSTFG